PSRLDKPAFATLRLAIAGPLSGNSAFRLAARAWQHPPFEVTRRRKSSRVRRVGWKRWEATSSVLSFWPGSKRGKARAREHVAAYSCEVFFSGPRQRRPTEPISRSPGPRVATHGLAS